MRNRAVWRATAVAVLALAAAPAAAAYPGDLDTTFNSTGYAVTQFPAGWSDPADVAVQPDGKVVVVGASPGTPPRQFAIARYNADGSLDRTFGADGLVTTSLGATGSAAATAVAIQADAKIVVGGTAQATAGASPALASSFALARYDANGALDPTFGTGGTVVTYIAGGGDFCPGVTLRALALHGGRIYAGGSGPCGRRGDHPYVARYESDGSLDPTYGPGGSDGIDGVAGTDAFATSVRDMIVTADGGAVVVGPSWDSGFEDSTVVRFTPGGALDTAFGTGGGFERPRHLVAMIPVPGGRFVTLTDPVGGTSRISLSRFDATTGEIDLAFGSGGTVTTPLTGEGGVVPRDLARDPDGRLVVASTRAVRDPELEGVQFVGHLALHRWSANGVRDRHFGTKGEATTPLGAEALARALAIDPAGRPVVAGCWDCQPGEPHSFAVARFVGGTGANRPPVAAFGYSPSEPRSGESIIFDATASDDPDGPIVSYRWDLDGSGSFASDSGSQPYLSGGISFPRPGTYTVRLRVQDEDGATATTSRDVTVRGWPPDARVSASPTAAFTGQSVIFDATASSDPDGSIVNYRWDLDGSGTFATDTGATPTTHTAFATPGQHTVRVRTTDDTGMQATAAVTVTVVAREPGPGSDAPPGPSPGPPDGGDPGRRSVTINRGARFTNSRAVTLHIVPPAGATTLEVSNDASFADATALDVLPTGTYRWRLDARGPERVPRRVHVRFGPSLAATSRQPVSDSIVLDRTPPRLLPPVVAGRRSGVATIRVSASDRTSGVRGLHVTANRRRPGGLRRYRRAVRIRAAGSAVYVRAIDRAGNRSRWRRAR